MKSHSPLGATCLLWLRELRYEWLPYLVFVGLVVCVAMLYRDVVPPDKGSAPSLPLEQHKLSPVPSPVVPQRSNGESRLVHSPAPAQFTNYSQLTANYSHAVSAKPLTNKSLADFQRLQVKLGE